MGTTLPLLALQLVVVRQMLKEAFWNSPMTKSRAYREFKQRYHLSLYGYIERMVLWHGFVSELCNSGRITFETMTRWLVG
jgi:hypothetical protein